MLNYYGSPMPQTLVWKLEDVAGLSYDAGYGGLEWHPLRGSRAGVQMARRKINQEEADSIRSLHQSFRGDINLFEMVRGRDPFMKMTMGVLLPEAESSVVDLLMVKRLIKRDVPVVVYPGKCSRQEWNNFGNKLFQPTSDIMRRWEVKTPEELIKMSKRMGFDGFALDLYHMRRKASGGFSLNPWRETLPRLLDFTKELHISAGRLDISDGGVDDTMAELEDLTLAGRNRTELSAMIKTIAETGWRGRVVTEIPMAAVRELRSGSKLLLTRRELAETHQKISDYLLSVLM